MTTTTFYCTRCDDRTMTAAGAISDPASLTVRATCSSCGHGDQVANPAYIPAVILPADCGDTVQTIDGPLVVNSKSWPRGTKLEDVRAGLLPEWVTLTEDGRGYLPGWHQGPDAQEDWVRVERYTAEGRVFHGYVHRESRQLLQTG